MAQSETNRLSMIVKLILVALLIVGAIFCIYIIIQGKMTDRESAMLGIFVAILSVLASWLVTAMYGSVQYSEAIEEVRQEHLKNLRTYALKAAEKVNNLSNELNRLSIYLEEELNFTDYRSTEEELVAKEERIESAIHLIRTLKSVNDTGLSDWEGVIGEELDQRREEQEEKEEALNLLVSRVESLIEDHRQDFVGSQSDTKRVRQEVEGLKRELRLATNQLGAASIPRRVLRKESKQEVEGACPACRAGISYRQRSLIRSVKLLTCKNCETKLISTYTESVGFSLKVREVELVNVSCPDCGVGCEFELDNFPGSNIATVCDACSHSFRAIRTHDGRSTIQKIATVVTPVERKAILDDAVIERVRSVLPAQPWPTGIHLKIARNLLITPSEVRRSMEELIKRGTFHRQVNGVIYVPLKTNNLDSTANAIE